MPLPLPCSRPGAFAARLLCRVSPGRACDAGRGTEDTGPGSTDTAAAARSAASQYLALYSAGQWQAAWQYLAPSAKKLAPC